jgi:hypothetical protein
MEASSVVCARDSRALQNLGMMYRQVRLQSRDAFGAPHPGLQVGMIAESVRSIARAFQVNPRDALAVVSLLEVVARERSIAVAEGINATAVTLMAQEFSDNGDIRATKALAELYNSGGHYGHARDLLVRALKASTSSVPVAVPVEGKQGNAERAWSAKCLLMNLAHAGMRCCPPPAVARPLLLYSC